MTPRPVLAGILLFAMVIPGYALAALANASLTIGALAVAAALTLAALSKPR